MLVPGERSSKRWFGLFGPKVEGPAAAAMLGIHIDLIDSAAEYFGVPCVVAGVLATYEGYRSPRPGPA